MIIKSSWENKYSKEQIDWKANGEKRVNKMMEEMKQKQDSLRQQYIQTDEHNRSVFPFGK